MKVIFHLDLDSYFVSAERTVNPFLLHKPVAITTGERRSIVAAVSYEARAMGVQVPMPFFMAQKLCSQLIAVKPNYALYVNLSTKMFELISDTFTPMIEIMSVDECFIDVTDVWKKYGSPMKLALVIQDTIMTKLKLPISIGISNNKFVAKMSTSVNKPYGITLTKPGDHAARFWSWELKKFYGIGGPSALKLNAIGIMNIGDLAQANPDDINNILGKRGSERVWEANGGGSDEINLEHNKLKGIGNSQTFMIKDLSDRDDILKELSRLTHMVTSRAEMRNTVGKVVSVSIKEAGGKEVKVIRKQKSLQRPINSHADVFKEAVDLFDDIWKNNKIKYIGVHLGKLSDMFESSYQMSVFDKPIVESKIETIVKTVNRKMKTKAIMTGKEGRLNIKRKRTQSRYIESDRILKHYDK
ncbi:DNA polymerase Y family protein [Candidatus Mycoplasma mahonii]|uniref:DNA polymerase Y family protein n=1 Tax=Candidatus Mycoplasma mahonii TaxID=3004105 RepID=UPI0026E926CD|nr:DNA polymerase IV [Candidatus Mycoplasma mahonii]WKX02201.1 DNA polymerase IV [Candidatus Mycoplasma mahonii]